ncbi:hypothetical protein ACQ4LE_004919 [Meloidogyne hapla]
MPPKIRIPSKEIKITDEPNYSSDDTSEYISESDHSKIDEEKIDKTKDNTKSKSKRKCLTCEKNGFPPNVYNNHISSNRSCPYKNKLEHDPIIVSSNKPVAKGINIGNKINDKNIEIENDKIDSDILENANESEETDLKKIKENEKEVGIKIVNNLLNKRMKDDEKEKLNLPKIPKRPLPLKEDVFYHSPVTVHAPKKTERLF